MNEDYRKLLEFLVENPQPKDYSIGNGLYKIRLKIGSLKKGKSEGSRVITAVLAEKTEGGLLRYIWLEYLRNLIRKT